MTESYPDGWNALRMHCPTCAGAAGNHWCDTCHGTGWHPNSHVVNDGLFIGGGCVAKVESFDERGPWYANAITPEGEHWRLVGGNHASAADWCERIVGLHPRKPDDFERAGRLA